VNPRYLDRNYGATLIVWDRLFGTFAEEREAPVFGTVAPLRSFNPLWAQVAHWAALWRTARSLPRRRARLRIWVARPDWPPSPEHGPVAGPRAKWDRPLSAAARAWAVLWFAPVVVVTFLMLLHANDTARAPLAAGFAFVVATLAGVGGLLDGRPWARPVEAARVAGLAVALVAWIRIG
jgi:sterol desaturase/sphingolipid hydroxylase (fatty acid hydroxylase superfamily)